MSADGTVIYVDGKKSATIEDLGSNVGSHGAFIGYSHDGSGWSHFHGLIDESSIWTRALDSTEVEQIYSLVPQG